MPDDVNQSDEPPVAEVTCDTPGPDWDRIDHEVLCPLCEYNVRGLIDPRCPECGYRFDWPEILDPRRQEHDYLFEHHPERPIWSYGRTTIGACRPRRFWTSLHPAQRSRPYRLIAYWCIGAACLWFASLSLVVNSAARQAGERDQRRAEALAWMEQDPAWAPTFAARDGSVQTYLDRNYPEGSVVRELSRMYGSLQDHRLYWHTVFPLIVVVPLGWAWLSFVSLMIFQFSMRRARVKHVHVLRCALYSFDLLPFCGCLVLAVPILPFFRQPWYFRWDWVLGLGIVLTFGILFGTWRLATAYRRYLRFDRPWATVLASQCIVALAVAAALCAYEFQLVYGLFVALERLGN